MAVVACQQRHSAELVNRLGNLPPDERLAQASAAARRTLLRWALNACDTLGLGGQRGVIALPYLWLALFFLVPFLIVLKISFAEQLIAQPPYSALIERTASGYLTLKLNLNACGVHKGSLFPDIDGLAEYQSWLYKWGEHMRYGNDVS